MQNPANFFLLRQGWGTRLPLAAVFVLPSQGCGVGPPLPNSLLGHLGCSLARIARSFRHSKGSPQIQKSSPAEATFRYTIGRGKDSSHGAQTARLSCLPTWALRQLQHSLPPPPFLGKITGDPRLFHRLSPPRRDGLSCKGPGGEQATWWRQRKQSRGWWRESCQGWPWVPGNHAWGGGCPRLHPSLQVCTKATAVTAFGCPGTEGRRDARCSSDGSNVPKRRERKRLENQRGVRPRPLPLSPLEQENSSGMAKATLPQPSLHLLCRS